MIEPVGHYLRGLMQADPNKKNMERMEERVADADEQQLQQMLTDSPWDHQAVMDQVALEADQWLGGHPNSCLLIDESGFKKSGKHSVGVARQWCGRLGKVDNCQVGVFAALGRDRRVTLVDERLYLPEKWCDDAQRCEQAGIPEADRVFKTKVALALEMVAHQRRIGVRFSWVGADGFYGNDPAFLRGLAATGEVFVADVHCNQLIFLDDPKPTIKQKKGKRGRNPTKLEANAAAIRVDQWQTEQPDAAWQRVKVRDSSRGELEVEVLHRRVWLWDNEEPTAHGWHLIVRREINAREEIKYTLSNAPGRDAGQAIGRDAGAALLGGARLPGWQIRMRHGGLSGAQMERLASSHGLGVHGDAVHVGGAIARRRRASAVELLRHRGAVETVSATARGDAGSGLGADGKAPQEALCQHTRPIRQAGH